MRRLRFEQIPTRSSTRRNFTFSIRSVACLPVRAWSRDGWRTILRLPLSCWQCIASTLFGTNLRASYLDAVQAMATAAHCGELDDIHGGAATCIGGMIVPALLAMAEKHGGSGRQFLEAAIAGYETIARIGLSIDAPKLFARGWWPSTVCGAFGVAAAGAKFLGWPVEQDRQRTRHRLSARRRHAHRRQRRRDGAPSGFRPRGAEWHARTARDGARIERAEARVGRSARFLSDALRRAEIGIVCKTSTSSICSRSRSNPIPARASCMPALKRCSS